MIAEVRYRRIVESRASITAAVYLIAMGLWIYVVEERQLFYGQPETNLPLTLILAGVQVGAGLLVGRWWALALPLVAVALAVPAGYPDANKGEPLPTWLGLVVVSPVAVILVGAGVAAARGLRRLRVG
jgi:peptidoglycan/LPS O-acetylase OafA/YrhL